MNKGILKKILVLGLMLALINIVPSICGNTINKTNNNNPIAKEVLFSDDFNDNSKDFGKWTELFNEGEWWERNGQTEFRLYEYDGHWRKQGIETIDIPVTMEYNQLTIEAIMDTYIDSHGANYVGQPHMRVVDSSDPDNAYIDVYFRRDNGKVIVADSSGALKTIGYSDEFRDFVTIKIESDGYQVDVGELSSDWISRTIFPSEFDLRFRIYIQLAGDYPDLWWMAGFDEVEISQNHQPNKPTITGPESGGAGKSLLYAASCTDPDMDQLHYLFDWGDGNDTGWVGPYNSGDEIYESHIWEAEGQYVLKVKARDENGLESLWSDPLILTVPRNRAITNHLWIRFLETYPKLFLLFNFLQGLK